MFWLVPVVIGGVAAGAALLFGGGKEPDESDDDRDLDVDARRKRREAPTRAQLTNKQDKLRRQNYRSARNDQINQFAAAHQLTLKSAKNAMQTYDPEALLGKVEQAVTARIAEIEQPAAELQREVDELSAIRTELVSMLDECNAATVRDE